MRLDKNTVAGLGLPEGISDKIHFDAELSGFGYRVRRSTSGELLRSYVAQYRSNGASKRLLIGDASKITCAQARDIAKKALADVVRGQDPSAVKADRRAKDELRFSMLVARYIMRVHATFAPARCASFACISLATISLRFTACRSIKSNAPTSPPV